MKPRAAARVDLRERGAMPGARLRLGIKITIKIMIMIMIIIMIMIERQKHDILICPAPVIRETNRNFRDRARRS